MTISLTEHAPERRIRPAHTDGMAGLVVLGGSNLIAGYLLRRLAAQGRGALVMARRPVELPATCDLLLRDALQAGGWTAPAGSSVVSVLPIATLVRMLPHLAEAKAIVAIGSTSVLSKGGSEEPYERAIAQSLAASEAALAAWCTERGIRYTILRPTLVYDGRGDRNVARMAQFIRKFGILPVARPASGLRQPIHADDIAKSILGALDNEAAYDRTFNIAGGEILTYRAMAERVFAAQGRKARFLMLSTGVLGAGFWLAARCGLVESSSPTMLMFRRMNQDLVFDVEPGLDVLGYRPRPFEIPGA